MTSAVVSMIVSSFSLSFCLGPLLWSPLSEQYGRRPVLLISFNLFTVTPLSFLSVATSMTRYALSFCRSVPPSRRTSHQL
ncbi:hypothetical protein C8Q80DRAFT_1178379 [Daedaleopsis nitida]|nr:hypothetical protein C8Q80DRAFT_1178379 [Daedaleopsis nitida]